MGFPRQKYWNGLPFPSPEGLPNLGIKPTSALALDSLSLSPGELTHIYLIEFTQTWRLRSPQCCEGELKPQERQWLELQCKSTQAQDPRKAGVSDLVCKDEKIVSWLKTVGRGDSSCLWEGQPFCSMNLPGRMGVAGRESGWLLPSADGQCHGAWWPAPVGPPGTGQREGLMSRAVLWGGWKTRTRLSLGESFSWVESWHEASKTWEGWSDGGLACTLRLFSPEGRLLGMLPLVGFKDSPVVVSLLTKVLIVKAMVFTRRRQWHPTPVLCPGESHGPRSLVGCSPWGR